MGVGGVLGSGVLQVLVGLRRYRTGWAAVWLVGVVARKQTFLYHTCLGPLTLPLLVLLQEFWDVVHRSYALVPAFGNMQVRVLGL